MRICASVAIVTKDAVRSGERPWASRVCLTPSAVCTIHVFVVFLCLLTNSLFYLCPRARTLPKLTVAAPPRLFHAPVGRRLRKPNIWMDGYWSLRYDSETYEDDLLVIFRSLGILLSGYTKQFPVGLNSHTAVSSSRCRPVNRAVCLPSIAPVLESSRSPVTSQCALDRATVLLIEPESSCPSYRAHVAVGPASGANVFRAHSPTLPSVTR